MLKSIKNINIIGTDNLNDYYEISLKEYRLKQIQDIANNTSEIFIFIKGNIAEKEFIKNIFEQYTPYIVVNLAAQAGVRYSIVNPDTYIESNIIGFYNILEASRYSLTLNYRGVEHLIFASSSSVYGDNEKVPYSIGDKTDSPISLYAATKKSDEILAYSYAKLYGVPIIGLRFFTIYGAADRPDMTYFTFTKRFLQGKNITVFNYGNCKRDFTYIDDVIIGIKSVMQCSPSINSKQNRYKMYNIGNNNPVKLLDFIQILCKELKLDKVLDLNYKLEEHIDLVEKQPGDMDVTYADISSLEKGFGFRPSTSLQEGLREFTKWYYQYYEIGKSKK